MLYQLLFCTIIHIIPAIHFIPMIFPVMDEIRKVVLTAPVKAGTIVLHNVCGLDSDVMVTKNVAAK